MTAARPIAASLVAFDGHPVELALEAIARAGATRVEPAFIAGTMLFAEDDLSETSGRAMSRLAEAAGLGCVAVSMHMDCGAEDARPRLERRLRYAAGLGAQFLITNTARRDRRDAFLRLIADVLPEAERLDVAFAFENPGHGADDLLRTGADAGTLLAAIGSSHATLNYDVGNTLTNSEGAVRPEADLLLALPIARHMHLKDMTLRNGAWSYSALGDGDLDYHAILRTLASRPDLPVCVELPMRQVRLAHRPPTRAGELLPIPALRDLVTRSVRRVRSGVAT